MPEANLLQNLLALFKRRASTLDLFPDYLESVIAQWNDLFFLSIPALPFVVWWYLGEPPMWIKAPVFVWIFLTAGYYAWRKEAAENRQTVAITVNRVEPHFGHYMQGETYVMVSLRMAVWNGTDKPTIVTNWRVAIPELDILREPEVFSDDEISTHPIAPGARSFCTLRVLAKRQLDNEELTQTLRDRALTWDVFF
ncbi:MAG: hypothetical protein WA993_17585, partial [Candidatus Binatus sp.]